MIFQPTQNNNVPEFQGGFLSGPNFQSFDFFFSPSFRWVLPMACLGLRLPRPNTAAQGSPQRPRFRGPAAPRGEGGRGCTAYIRPWPPEKDIGGETSWNMGFLFWGSEWRCWWFTDGSTFWWILFSQIFGKAYQNICTNVWCCCLWTQLYLFLHFGSESLWIKYFSLEIEWHAHHNPKLFLRFQSVHAWQDHYLHVL